jgi:ribosomal protein S18 acetylase RimI-like enzyme
VTPEVALRPATDRDRPLLEAVYASVREPELAPLPWTPEQKAAFVAHQFHAQDHHYRTHYEGAAFDVIEVDGEPAGRLYVFRGAEDIRVVDIALLPAYRGRGIGERLLRALRDEAGASGRTLSIHVEHENPARRLYERLGLRVAGEHPPYLYMEWSA